MRYVHILEHVLVYRLELGLMLLNLLYVRPQEPRPLILQLRPEGLEYRGDGIAEIDGLAPLTIFDFVVYVLLTAQQHYQQREIALVHRIMQRCEVQLPCLLLEVEERILVVILAPSQLVVMIESELYCFVLAIVQRLVQRRQLVLVLKLQCCSLLDEVDG